MPKSARVFHTSPLSRLRRLASTSAFSLACFVLGITGILFGVISVSRPVRKCPDLEPRSVSVVWDHGGGTGGGGTMERRKVMAFVGIQTGFGSFGRRRSIRRTWLPSHRQGLLRLEEATGLAFRFVVGKTKDKSKMAALQLEVNEYDDFMLLDIEEEYSNLPHKTLAFFKAAFALYDSDFYVKADDDIYLRPDRLSLLLAKDRQNPQTYLGCMKKGPVFTDPKLKCFRMFSNEDVTIGAWMLAMNVNHENVHSLCEPDCTPSSIAVWDIPKCSGREWQEEVTPQISKKTPKIERKRPRVTSSLSRLRLVHICFNLDKTVAECFVPGKTNIIVGISSTSAHVVHVVGSGQTSPRRSSSFLYPPTSSTVRALSSAPHPRRVTPVHFCRGEEIVARIMASGQQANREEEVSREEEQAKREAMSLQEIGHYRATAQQNSIESIRAAEERYEKAKHAGLATVHHAKEAVDHGLGATGAYTAAKGTEAKDAAAHGARAAAEYTAEKGSEAKDYAAEKARAAAEVAAQKAAAAKDVTIEKGRQGLQVAKDTAAQAAVKSKDVAVSAGETAADYAKQAAVKAKDVTVSTGETAMEYAKEAAAKTKDVTVYTGQTAADYVKRAAMKTKDVTAGAGEIAMDYAKQAAGKAKDVTISTGQTTAEYAQQAAAKTKDATLSAAECARETAVGAKDTAAEATQKTIEEAKETAKAMGQGAMEKAEEAKEAAKGRGGRAMGYTSKKAEEAKEAARAMARKAVEKAQEAREAAKGTGEGAMRKARAKAEEAMEAAKRALEYAALEGGEEEEKTTEEDTAEKASEAKEKRGEKTEEAKRITEGAKQEAGEGEAKETTAMETGDEAKHEKATEPQKVKAGGGGGEETQPAKIPAAVIEVTMQEASDTTAAAGELLETIGVAVTEIAMSTADMIIGSEAVVEERDD
ncbi:Galactosyltransferase [Musa troglodytarum]|uniref:Galactosyltransferase n=1 Tax=Musa troglodytarum TaxID=320322 RepID=A0A9E7LFE1_9LILI|nr:Galactosyltransferase [Musa troglodytarum]